MTGGVGADDLGRRAIEALHLHGVDTSCVAVVDRPTGQVRVKLDAAGRASYEFAADAAWDNVAWSDGLQQLAARADAVCFSTLGQRSKISRQTIQRFVRATPAKCLRVLDINLRPPFWNEEIVLQSVQLANVLKVNDAELSVLAGMRVGATRIINYCNNSWTSFHCNWWPSLAAPLAQYC
jgi:fructokinase